MPATASISRLCVSGNGARDLMMRRPENASTARLRDHDTESPRPSAARSWSLRRRGRIAEVGYGGGTHFPQYAALHTESGFLRLNYGPGAAWGTSIVVLPSFWCAARYYQGAPLSLDWRIDGRELVLSFTARISSLRAQGEVRLQPPARNCLSGTVSVELEGRLELDRRPGEAFKLVAFSSMHISDGVWDVSSVQIDARSFPIPRDGWLMRQPVPGRLLVARGGSSVLKTNAPTLELQMDRRRTMTGWVTPTTDSNDDNVSAWVASDHAVPSWRYGFAAKR